ncbi:zinc finger protein 823-like isoform X2 [Cydia pomonella]|uniref:zinc finger protein 823-like isoform X2 n=1 Tax=Cydia pomonella TaxID=82600 RepID=UPI002ADD9AFF|nr:zinc finger protein 823-like isoform X2 [Cydia pomonella]
MEAVVMKTELSWDAPQPACPPDTHGHITEVPVVSSASVKQEPITQLHAVYLKEEVIDLQEDVKVKREGTEPQEDVEQDVMKQEPEWEETSKLSGLGVSQLLEFTDNMAVELEIEYEKQPAEAGGTGTTHPCGSETPDPCGSETVDTDTCKKRTAQEAKLDQELVVLRKDRARSVKQAREHTASTEANSYDCLMCTRTFKCLTTYKQHMTTMHTGQSQLGPTNHEGVYPYSCKLCHESFAEQSDLKNYEPTHMRIHGCDSCGSQVVKLYYLKRHLRTHTG